MPPSAAAKPGLNHNSIGDLVPMHKKLSGNSKALERVLNDVTGATRDGSPEGWHVLSAPILRAHQQRLMAPASTCVVQLPGEPAIVGVLKMPMDGHCTLFVRLKRDLLSKWAAKHNADVTARRAFYKPDLDLALARTILGKARSFSLEPGEVHHPYALSILCSMSLGKWLVPADPKGAAIPQAFGSLSLVALPPVDSNLEQCLCLLGHRATFGNCATTDGSGSDDDDVPLSGCVVDKAVWGETHGSTLRRECSAKFKEAATIFAEYSDPHALTVIVPALNGATKMEAANAGTCLRAMAVACSSADSNVPYTTPQVFVRRLLPGPKPKAAATPKPTADAGSSSTAAASAVAPSTAESPSVPEVELLPSDPSEDELPSGDDGEGPEPEPEVAPAPAPARAPRQPKRAREEESDEDEGATEKGSSDEEGGGNDEGDGSSSESDDESDEEEEGEDEAECVDTGDDEGTDADDEEEEGEEEEGEEEEEEGEEEEEEGAEEEASKPKKKQKVEHEDAKEYAKAVAEEACNKIMLVSMRTLLHQSFKDVEALKPLVSPELMEKLEKIMWDSCCKAMKPTELILAVNELVRTLANAHAEQSKGETVTVNRAEYERTHKLASAAVNFSEATMERVCKAMDQLEEARTLGRAALEPMQMQMQSRP